MAIVEEEEEGVNRRRDGKGEEMREMHHGIWVEADRMTERRINIMTYLKMTSVRKRLTYVNVCLEISIAG